MLARFLRSVGLAPAMQPTAPAAGRPDTEEKGGPTGGRSSPPEPATATAAATPRKAAPKRRRASPPPTPRLLAAPRLTRAAAAANQLRLQDLPRDVLTVEVLPHLAAKDVVSLRAACREIRDTVVSPKRKKKANARSRVGRARPPLCLPSSSPT